jgi:predicted nucleic acid-binding protein
MRCCDTTFPIDSSRGDPRAGARVREVTESSERIATPAAAAAEVLMGAHFRGGPALVRTSEFLEPIDI